MSIKDRQNANAIDRILKEYLTGGRFPEVVEIQQRLLEVFAEKPAGLPRFSPRMVEPDELSDPTEYNSNMQDVKEDLDVSFAEMNWQANRFLAVAGAYDTEKKRIELQLRKLEERLARTRNQFPNPTDHVIVSDDFHSFEKIDFGGDAARGIPKTNALIDLRYGQALLESLNMGGAKYDLSESSYAMKLMRGSGSGKEYLPFSNALRDSLNEVWEYRVESNKVEPVEVSVVIALKEACEATSASIILHSPKPTKVKLEIADDNEIFHEVMVQEGVDRIEWKMDERVRYMRLTFSKNEPDFSHETVHEYQFGASNISLLKEVYVPDGYVVSRPHDTDGKAISKVVLSKTDIVFARTGIRYYVGLDNGIDMVEWQEIEPGKALDVQRMNAREESIAKGSPGYGVKKAENFGVDFYQAGTLAFTPETKSVLAKMGAYMWKVESIANPDGAAHEPSLSDWVNPKNVETKFYPIEKTIGAYEMPLPSDKLCRVSTTFVCSEESSVLNNRFVATNAKAVLYVNNTLIRPVIDASGHVYYNYRFKKGLNIIQFVTSQAADASSFKANLYLKDIASDIYAHEDRLTEVTLYDLYNNVSKKDYTKFAIDGAGVIVNYDPIALDASGGGIRYDVSYRYATDEAVQSQIRFMAILSRNDGNNRVSPVLKRYQLRIE